MQRLAGIKTNLNESIGGYRDIQPLREAPDFNGMPIDQIRKYADAGNLTAKDIVRKHADDEHQLRRGQSSNPDDDGNCEGNMSFVPGYGCMEENEDCPGCKRMKEEEEGDEQNAAFNNFYNKVKDGESMGDMEQGKSVTGEEGWEANTLADIFSNSGKDAIKIAKQLDFLLHENCQDDIDDIVDLIFYLALAYHDDKVNNPDPTFDEAKEKKGEDEEKKGKDYKGMNMRKGDILNKVGKGSTNTKKGEAAKNYVPVHASSKGKTNESKIKPNKDFLW
jgi:hypothetical protein